MLKIYNPNDVADIIPFPIANDMRFVTHKYNGYDTLTFEIASNHELYQYIVEETKIEDEKNRYIVKVVDEHSDFVTVECEIDLDDWKNKIFYEYRRTNASLADIFEDILPDGWSVAWLQPITKRTTIEDIEGKPMIAATPLEIVDKASSAYSCVFNFDVLNKTVTVVDPNSYTVSGQFFTDELNLKNLGYVGTSNGFATRLYAYGKKDENGAPLTIADVNDGKPYVEDYSYSNKIICIGWSDERYTTAESLKAVALEKLKSVSFPSRSYTCDAQNLNEDVWLYKVVTLIDRRRKTRVDHQIVEFKEYPDHTLDIITLSKTQPNIESFISRVESNAQDEIAKEVSNMQVLLQDVISEATDKITGNKGGHFAWIFDSEGRPVELVNLVDSLDINKAKSVWRWNASGLGHSNDGYNGQMTLAFLSDGSINASVITAGTLTANILRAGKISDLKGHNFWDLETGDFSLSANTVVKDGNSETQLKDFVEKSLDQEMTFNALTNNGASQGVFLRDGKLFINVEYLSAGKINAENIGLNGLFEVWFIPPSIQGGNAVLGGYVGYMSGSVEQGMVTDGIALLNAQKDCYVIVTSMGCRVQAGSSDLYLGKNGKCIINTDVQINGNLSATGTITDKTN